MGRRTFESIDRPLPQRHNIVVTRDRSYVADGCTMALSVEGALSAAGNVLEIAVIRGAQIFEELLPRADILHVTYVHAEIDGETFFPPLNPENWLEHERKELGAGPTNTYPCPSSRSFAAGFEPDGGRQAIGGYSASAAGVVRVPRSQPAGSEGNDASLAGGGGRSFIVRLG